MNQLEMFGIILLFQTLYFGFFVYPKTSLYWSELVALTGDKRLAHKLLRRSVKKHLWRGPVYQYWIALESYKHHLIVTGQYQASDPVEDDEFYTASPALLSELNSLTHSREVSDRLILHLASKYPDQPINWVIEKAITDLENDRRR